MSDDIWVAEIQEWARGLEEIRELIGGDFAQHGASEQCDELHSRVGL